MQKFWDKVRKDDDGCWYWTGHKRETGYGRFMLDGKVRSAHRVSYQMHFGEIPEGKEIDHLCRNRSCVNPKHLEAVTHQINCSRGIDVGTKNRNKTHCAKGHAFDAKNTYYNGKQRVCRACQVIYVREYRARKKRNAKSM